MEEVEKRKTQKSYDEQVIEKYGEIGIQDDFSKTYNTNKSSPIFEFSREGLYKDIPPEDLLPKENSKKKGKKEAKPKAWEPKSDFDLPFVAAKKLDNKHLFVD